MKRGERGLTLLEMIVATLIMGVAVVGLLSAVTTSMRNAARVTDYDRAVQLGRGKMDEILLDRAAPRDVDLQGRFDPSQTGGVEGGWRARITAVEAPPRPHAGSPVLDRVDLEIWWGDAEQRHSFRLDGYRTRVLSPEDIPPAAPQ